MLAKAAPLIASAIADVDHRRDELIASVAGQLEQLVGELDQAAGYTSEATWLAQAGELVASAGQSRRAGRIRPYAERRLPTDATSLVRQAIAAIRGAEERAAEHRLWLARQAEVELPPPPTPSRPSDEDGDS